MCDLRTAERAARTFIHALTSSLCVRPLLAPLPFRPPSPCLPLTQYGNVSRFVNHACGAAANLRCWLECGRRRVVLYPTRPIRSGEELTFDYGLFSESAKTPGQSER